MSSQATSPFLRNLSMDLETAYEHVALLENGEQVESEGCTVFSGTHPEYGNIHIVIPNIGAAGTLLLPFVVQQF